MAVAALVLGILSLVIELFLSWVGLGWVAMIVGIIGIALGALGRKDPSKAGMATAGLVMSIIGVALGLISWIACIACAGIIAENLPSYYF